MTKKRMIIMSGWQGKNRSRKKFEENLVKQLLAIDGLNILRIPHLYYLKNNYSIYKKILGFKGDLFVCSWLFERASEWILKKEMNLPDKRPVNYFSFLKYKSPEKLVVVLKKSISPADDVKSVDEIENFERQVERWYPVLDYSKCKKCKKCLEFCIFGVYTLGEKKKIKVENPENCKPGCPACSRICPAGAIMFPHYFEDKKICGGGR